MLNDDVHSAPAAQPEIQLPSTQDGELMAKHAISYDGKRYLLGPYRYDRLADAVNYAQLMAAKGVAMPAVGNTMPFVTAALTQSDRDVMLTLGITLENGVYRLSDYRYDRLADAVHYARLKTQRIAS